MKKWLIAAAAALCLALLCGAAGADIQDDALRATAIVVFGFPDGSSQTTLGMMVGEAGQESACVLLDDWYYTDQTGVTESSDIQIISPVDFSYYTVRGTRSLTDSRLLLLVADTPVKGSRAMAFAPAGQIQPGDEVKSVEMLLSGDDSGSMQVDKGTVEAIEPWGNGYSDVFLNIRLQENSGTKGYTLVLDQNDAVVGFNYDVSLDDMFQRAFDGATLTSALDVFGVPFTVQEAGAAPPADTGSTGSALGAFFSGLGRITGGGHTVSWSDPALGGMVEKALGHKPTPDELSRVEALYLLGPDAQLDGDMPEDLSQCDQGPVKSLDDLKYFPNLQTLWITSNDIADLTPVSALSRLTFLSVCYGQVADVSPLSGLTSLEEVYLYDNSIEDISPLSGLTRLTCLGLGVNSIRDISPLSGLTALEFLRIHSNAISDITPLSGLTRLEDLVLAGNEITDLSPLSGLTGLFVLRIGNNRITSLAPISGLTRLEELSLYKNQVSDLTPIAGLTELTSLDIESNRITDIGVLAGLTKLEWIDISGNQITDESPVDFVKEVIRD